MKGKCKWNLGKEHNKILFLSELDFGPGTKNSSVECNSTLD